MSFFGAVFCIGTLYQKLRLSANSETAAPALTLSAAKCRRAVSDRTTKRQRRGFGSLGGREPAQAPHTGLEHTWHRSLAARASMRKSRQDRRKAPPTRDTIMHRIARRALFDATDRGASRRRHGISVPHHHRAPHASMPSPPRNSANTLQSAARSCGSCVERASPFPGL